MSNMYSFFCFYSPTLNALKSFTIAHLNLFSTSNKEDKIQNNKFSFALSNFTDMQKGDKKTQIKKSASKYAEKIKVDATFIELLNLTFKDADKKVKARSNKKNY